MLYSINQRLHLLFLFEKYIYNRKNYKGDLDMEQLLDILKEMNDTIDYESEKALIDGEIIDSLDLMELISEMEEAFDITIEMEDIIPENFNSAEAMWELITRLQDN